MIVLGSDALPYTPTILRARYWGQVWAHSPAPPPKTPPAPCRSPAAGPNGCLPARGGGWADGALRRLLVANGPGRVSLAGAYALGYAAIQCARLGALPRLVHGFGRHPACSTTTAAEQKPHGATMPCDETPCRRCGRPVPRRLSPTGTPMPGLSPARARTGANCADLSASEECGASGRVGGADEGAGQGSRTGYRCMRLPRWRGGTHQGDAPSSGPPAHPPPERAGGRRPIRLVLAGRLTGSSGPR